MNTACGPFIEVTQPPIGVLKNFVLHQTGNSNADNEVIKLLIKTFNNLIAEVRSDAIIKMSKDEAIKYLKNVEPLLTELPEVEQELYALDEKKNESIPMVKEMWSNLKGMIDDIRLIANRVDVDENSEDYKNFIHEIMEKESGNNKTFGKKRLMDLFE